MASLDAIERELERRQGGSGQQGPQQHPQQSEQPQQPPSTDQDRSAIIRDIRESTEPDRTGQIREAVSDFGTQFMRGITDAAAPIARLNPMGGLVSPTSEQAAQSSSLIAEDDPEGLAGRAGRLSGQAATFAVPAGGAASAIPRSAATGGRALTRVGRGLRNFLSDAGRTIRDRPIRSTAAEAGLGASAGAGGFMAEQKFPDSDASRVIGEILGGTAPALTPTSLAARGGRAAVGTARRLRQPFTQTGGRRRATERFERATPGRREQAAEQLDQPRTTDSETGQPVLTPAQRTDDPGLMSIERAVVDESEALQRGADEQIARANQVIQQQLRETGGDPSAASATFQDARQRLQTGLNTRLRIAAQRSDERIEGLEQNASREEANRIAREEIESAFSDARRQERELFEAIPQDAPVPTTSSQESVTRAVSEVGEAQRGDIPSAARRLLNPDAERFLGDTSNVQELRSLQSKLRETARRARSADRNNQARIADDVADAITEDIANAGGEAAESAQRAVAYSRDMRQAFKRGEVGRLMGRSPQGGSQVAESLTLEKALTGGGPRARESFDQIVNALDNPAVIERTGGSSQRFREAADSFVTHQFLRSAAPEGQLNPQRAATFLRQNEEMLSRLPETRRQLQEATEAGNLRALRERQRSRVRFDDPKRSKATLFIQKGPVEAFEDIAGREPGVAARETANLLNQARRDPSGEAVAGLKGGFLDFLMTRSREGRRDIQGESFLSGFALRDRINDPSTRQAMQRLFDEGERGRINQMTRDLISLERRRQARPASEGAIGDRPGKFLNMVAGIAGAASGRRTAENMGVGATVQIPGMVADRFRDLVSSRVRDPAKRLIQDAIADESLFRELLQAEIGPDGELPQQASRRLNAWTAAVLSEQAEQSQQTEQPTEAPQQAGQQAPEQRRRQAPQVPRAPQAPQTEMRQ